jgi:hypothetical protein
MRSVLSRSWPLALLALVAAVFLFVGNAGPSQRAHAASPGGSPTPLLSCPNVDGSADNKVLVGDILAVVGAYFQDWPTTNYTYLYDTTSPYNTQTGLGGQERVDDILAVVTKYFTVCPLVDTQVAKATRWALDTDPVTPGNQPVPQTENAAALSALGYVGISTVDVPGQGVHYSKGSLWDGNFDPAAPEGLVYNDGRLAAQLYVVNGSSVGWLTEDPGPNAGPCGDGFDNGGDTLIDGADPDCVLGPPVGTPPDDVNIDPFSYCGAGVACSWAMDEGWHLHYRLCIVHIGTPYAHFVPLPSGQGQTNCDAIQNAPPNAGAGFDAYFERMGWMGHLWNWQPNANRVDDVNGTQNGRFADCFPDVQGWKAYSCPQ